LVVVVVVVFIQVYRQLDIGSMKPSRQARDEIPHHLLDVLDVGDEVRRRRRSSSLSPSLIDDCDEVSVIL